MSFDSSDAPPLILHEDYNDNCQLYFGYPA